MYDVIVIAARGSGWALVGDAGVHKDLFLALGVCDALRGAELLGFGHRRRLLGTTSDAGTSRSL